jgi:hypothetical protein
VAPGSTPPTASTVATEILEGAEYPHTRHTHRETGQKIGNVVITVAPER